jgi:hypothetical protein
MREASMLYKRILLVLPLMVIACMKPRAGGDAREISVVADDAAWATVDSILIGGLARTVTFLEDEQVFWVHRLPSELIDHVERRPSLLFVARADEPGPVADMISTVVGEDIATCAKEKPFLRLRDPWARGQLAFILVGSDSVELENMTAGAVRRLYEEYHEHYREAVLRRLYVRGPDLKRSAALRDTYGWSIEVPRPWQMTEDPNDRWVHFVKTQPDRHVSIHWLEWSDSSFTAEYCIRLRRELAWRHYDEDEVDDGRTSFSWTEFQGQKALEITGAWVNWKHTAGGPFRTICFLEETQERLYVIDLVTFAPDRPKFYVMTQLDIIAETFRTGEELGPFAAGTW